MSNLGRDMHDNLFRPCNANRVFVSKIWGWEDWIVNKPEYCGKKLFIKKGKQTSWHYHKIKDEVLYLESGEMEIAYGIKDSFLEGRRQVMTPGDSFHVPIGLRHRLIALQDCCIFEFSTEHFDEDSHRLPTSND